MGSGAGQGGGGGYGAPQMGGGMGGMPGGGIASMMGGMSPGMGGGMFGQQGGPMGGFMGGQGVQDGQGGRGHFGPPGGGFMGGGGQFGGQQGGPGGQLLGFNDFRKTDMTGGGPMRPGVMYNQGKPGNMGGQGNFMQGIAQLFNPNGGGGATQQGQSQMITGGQYPGMQGQPGGPPMNTLPYFPGTPPMQGQPGGPPMRRTQGSMMGQFGAL